MLTKQELNRRLTTLEAHYLEDPLRCLCVTPDGEEIIVSVDEMIAMGNQADFKRVVSGSSLKELDLILSVKIGNSLM